MDIWQEIDFVFLHPHTNCGLEKLSKILDAVQPTPDGQFLNEVKLFFHLPIGTQPFKTPSLPTMEQTTVTKDRGKDTRPRPAWATLIDTVVIGKSNY